MHHELHNLTRDGVLRVPGPLWIGFAILARHWVLMLVVIVSARRDPSAAALLGDSGAPWLMMALQAPVVLLAFAAWYRRPQAGRWARMVWRYGREIVAVTALLNIGWTAHLLIASDYWSLWPELAMASLSLIDLAVALSLYTTPHHRELFREFPRPLTSSTPGA